MVINSPSRKVPILFGCTVLKRFAALPMTLLLTVIGVAGCSNSPRASDKLTIFASTNVWGSIAETIGGEHVNVTAAVTRPEQDPHDYEATAQDKLAATKAKVIVVNGGGYDDWALTLAKSSKAPVINAFELFEAGHGHSSSEPSATKDSDGHNHAGANEHVFYSLEAAAAVATAIEKQLSQVDAANATNYAANLKTFLGKIEELQAEAAAFKKNHANAAAIATEPVVEYLLDDMGIKNITPEQFTQQSESDAGPSVAVVEETIKLIEAKKASVLIVNGQTTDEVSNRLVEAAKKAGVIQIPAHETFPEGTNDYITFVEAPLKALTKAFEDMK